MPAIDQPRISAKRRTPRCSVSRRCWQATLSKSVTCGNRGPSCGAAELLGEEENPLPNRLIETMKWRAGSMARPGPNSGFVPQMRPRVEGWQEDDIVTGGIESAVGCVGQLSVPQRFARLQAHVAQRVGPVAVASADIPRVLFDCGRISYIADCTPWPRLRSRPSVRAPRRRRSVRRRARRCRYP